MKIVYEKPEMKFVSFELSQSIAGGCSLLSNYAIGCPITVPEPGWEGIEVFADNCKTTPPNYQQGDQPCYDVPTEAYNIYTS